MTGSDGDSRRGYTAIVLAGKRPGIDPVAAANNETYKAMVRAHGKPMLIRVLAALGGATSIARIVIVREDALGDPENIPGFADAPGGKPVSYAEAGHSISAGVLSAIASRPDDARFLVTTSDHPLLTSEMVDEFLVQAQNNSGVCVAFVSKTIIEHAYPEMKRTFLKFRDLSVSGANLFAINDESGKKAIRFWERVESERKKPWRLAAAFGPVNLFGFFFKLFTLDQAFVRASRILNCPANAVLLEDANASVDVDKLSDLDFVNTVLAERESEKA